MAVIQGTWRVGSATTLGGGTDPDRRLVLSAMPDGKTYLVAKVFADDEGDFESTARLLAAASDLLAACRTVAHDLQAALDGDDFSGMPDEELFRAFLNVLRPAIAKAEGTDGKARSMD